MTTTPHPGDRIRYLTGQKKRARVGTVENIVMTLDGQDAATITKISRAKPVPLADIIEIYDPTKTKKRKSPVVDDGGRDQTERNGHCKISFEVGQEFTADVQIVQAQETNSTPEQGPKEEGCGLQSGGGDLENGSSLYMRRPFRLQRQADMQIGTAPMHAEPPPAGALRSKPDGQNNVDAGLCASSLCDPHKSSDGNGTRLAHKSAPKGLTAEQVREIRRRFKPHDPINGGAAMGREFGVGQPMISMIAHGVKRKGVE